MIKKCTQDGSSFYANFGGDGIRLFRNDNPGDNVRYESRTEGQYQDQGNQPDDYRVNIEILR